MKVPLLDLQSQYKSIKNEIRDAIDGVLETQHFILGPKVQELEEQVAEYSDCRFGIGVASGSDALLLSLMAIDIKPGDEIITTPYTFFATAGAIDRLGAKTVFVDINPSTYNIDVSKIEAKITPKTRAIIPVHLFGQCADLDPILDLASRYKINVIEDAAQAIGARYKGRRAGSQGDFGCFSFFPSKNLGGFGDGGMIVTNNEEMAGHLKTLRAHGSKPKYYHKYVGCNSRLDSIQAAILSVKLKYLDQWHQSRRQNADEYGRLFNGEGLIDHHISLPINAESCEHIYNQYVIRAKTRDELRDFLKQRDVATEVYYPVPLHVQECFGGLGYGEKSFPYSEAAAQETLALPVYPELSNEQQKYVVQTISEFYKSQG